MFSDEYVSVLEIENKKLFYSFLRSLMSDDCEKANENIVLLDSDKELKMSKALIIITDIVNLDLNSKKIISMAMEKLEMICSNDEEISNKLQELNYELALEVNKLINELSADFSISYEWKLSKYLKAFDFSPEKLERDDLCEGILRYLQIVSELFKNQVVCFVNAKSYFDEEQMQEIYKYALYNKIKLFLLESSCENHKQKYEKKLLIDKEFDEIII